MCNPSSLTIVAGIERVREETKQTVRDLKKAMGLAGVWNRIRRSMERHDRKP